MKDKFLLDPKVVYLNHGSFGAVPLEVIRHRQDLEHALEEQPVRFLQRRLFDLLEDARNTVGGFLNADPTALALIPNASTGVNIVARSLPLQQGDEILTTTHEYGACENILAFICQKNAAHLVVQDIPLPPRTDDEIVERLWEGVTERTKFIFLSHLTSPTATKFPVAEISRRAREAGILIMIDGAHAPGQLEVDIGVIDPDFYTGNCHKWMLSPLGSAFLYTRPDLQPLIDPLVVSWGWSGDLDFTTGSRYLDNLQWWGTYDPTPILSIPRAIQFMEDHDWSSVSAACRGLLEYSLERLRVEFGVETISTVSGQVRQQMAAVDLAHVNDIKGLKNMLYDRHHVEIPILDWRGRALMRISIQAYNTRSDIEVLVNGLNYCLDEDRKLS